MEPSTDRTGQVMAAACSGPKVQSDTAGNSLPKNVAALQLIGKAGAAPPVTQAPATGKRAAKPKSTPAPAVAAPAAQPVAATPVAPPPVDDLDDLSDL